MFFSDFFFLSFVSGGGGGGGGFIITPAAMLLRHSYIDVTIAPRYVIIARRDSPLFDNDIRSSLPNEIKIKIRTKFHEFWVQWMRSNEYVANQNWKNRPY